MLIVNQSRTLERGVPLTKMSPCVCVCVCASVGVCVCVHVCASVGVC